MDLYFLIRHSERGGWGRGKNPLIACAADRTEMERMEKRGVPKRQRDMDRSDSIFMTPPERRSHAGAGDDAQSVAQQTGGG